MNEFLTGPCVLFCYLGVSYLTGTCKCPYIIWITFIFPLKADLNFLQARRYGVRAAMPGFIARKLCPELIFVPTDFKKYTYFSDLTRKGKMFFYFQERLSDAFCLVIPDN